MFTLQYTKAYFHRERTSQKKVTNLVPSPDTCFRCLRVLLNLKTRDKIFKNNNTTKEFTPSTSVTNRLALQFLLKQLHLYFCFCFCQALHLIQNNTHLKRYKSSQSDAKKYPRIESRDISRPFRRPVTCFRNKFAIKRAWAAWICS